MAFFFNTQVAKMSNRLWSGLLFGVLGGSSWFRVVNLSLLLSVGADFKGLRLVFASARRLKMRVGQNPPSCFSTFALN